jgi:hypothetical protein
LNANHAFAYLLDPFFLLFTCLPSLPTNLLLIVVLLAAAVFLLVIVVVVVLAAGHGKAGGSGMNVSDRLSHPVSC